MSSDDALWEDSLHRRLFVGDGNPVLQLNDALAANMVFVKTFSIHEDKVVVYDAYQHQIAMFSLNGELAWIYGAPGEGPEHYSGNIEGVLNRYGLTIRDSSLSKLDLLGLDGTKHIPGHEWCSDRTCPSRWQAMRHLLLGQLRRYRDGF